LIGASQLARPIRSSVRRAGRAGSGHARRLAALLGHLLIRARSASGPERANVTVVDLTKLRAGDALHHGKFAESPEVVRLIGRRLAEGQDVSGSRIGLGDRIIQLTAGTAAAVGTTAGLAVSAPVAILDQQTRESLGEHAEGLGRSLSD
jgi:esterase/lipase superfamily enzyme